MEEDSREGEPQVDAVVSRSRLVLITSLGAKPTKRSALAFFAVDVVETAPLADASPTDTGQ